MSTKNKITLVLSLLLLLAAPSFANTFGLDSVIPKKKERCIVRFNVSPADVQATVVYKNKKRGFQLGTSLLGYPDSNQERQDQNLQCYHYTIAQCSNAMQMYNFFR